MRIELAAGAVALAALVGCNNNRANETGRAGESTDTVVTTQQTQDTALISHDTTVNVDTTMKEGDRATRTDTVKNTTGQQQPGAMDTSTTAR
jgi:hypothetical protein